MFKINFLVIFFSISQIACAQLLLSPTEVLNSPDKYNQKFIGMVGTAQYVETFINGIGERAMKFRLTDGNGNFVYVRLSMEEQWLTEGSSVQISGNFYKDYGLGLENNLVIVNQGSYGENIFPYEEDKTTKLLDGLLRKLLK